MTPDEIRRAYDDAAAAVLEEQRVALDAVVEHAQSARDAAALDAVRSRLFDSKP